MCAPLPAPSVPEMPIRPRPEVDLILAPIDWVVTCDTAMHTIRRGALAIDGGRLVGVGTADQILSICRGRETMDLSRFLVLPGLINTHVHGAMSCLRGLGDDLPLERWLYEVIFPAEAAIIDEETVYWGTLLSALEMLKNGITTFCDGYFFEEAAARAALDAGMRAVLGQGILDFPSPDQPDPSRHRDRAEAFLRNFPGDRDLVSPSLFCHAPYTCGAETLQWVKSLCREHDLLFQIHLSETASEVAQLRARHGETPVRYLDRLGILDDRTLCAHAVWIDDEEIAILSRRGIGISHNAESNMKLASGVAPIPRMLEAGLSVGLGTDGCASNNDLDLFSEMDRVATIHKAFTLDPTVCPARRVLGMATRDGAACLGLEDSVGTLEVGKRADLIAIDLDQPHLTPLYDPVSHLVYVVRGSDVRHVWVDGRLVLHNGTLLNLDEVHVMTQAKRLAAKLEKSPFFHNNFQML